MRRSASSRFARAAGWLVLLAAAALVCVVVLAEIDRKFSYPLSLQELYVDQKLRPLVSAYNTVVRAAVRDCPPIFSRAQLEETFPMHALFENQWREIAREALQVYAQQRLPAFHEVHEAFNPISSPQWTVFVLKWYDKPVEANMAKCPVTAACVRAVPQVQAAMFSILAPGTRIPPHRGPSCCSVRYHLGLKVPRGALDAQGRLRRARIRVDRAWYEWKEGEGVMFDDTYEHEVVNDTQEVRIVLFMDVLRKLPTALDRVNVFLSERARLSEFVSSINARAEVQEKVRM